jgi:hypothetical protein
MDAGVAGRCAVASPVARTPAPAARVPALQPVRLLRCALAGPMPHSTPVRWPAFSPVSLFPLSCDWSDAPLHIRAALSGVRRRSRCPAPRPLRCALHGYACHVLCALAGHVPRSTSVPQCALSAAPAPFAPMRPRSRCPAPRPLRCAVADHVLRPTSVQRVPYLPLMPRVPCGLMGGTPLFPPPRWPHDWLHIRSSV